MPYYTAPNTSEDHLFIFEESIRYCDLEQAEGRFSPLKSATRSAVNAYIAEYKPLVVALTLAKGNRTREVGESQTAKATLEETVRDYIEVLKPPHPPQKAQRRRAGEPRPARKRRHARNE